jgi:hypothetical protein
MKHDEYTITVQPLRAGSAIVRVHPGHKRVYGDPYVWFTVVEPDGKDSKDALLQGAIGAPPQGAARRIDEALTKAGYARRVYDRIVGGTIRRITKRLV